MTALFLPPAAARARAGGRSSPRRGRSRGTRRRRHRATYDWCSCGALESFTDARGQTTTFLYDVQGRVTSKLFADNKSQTYEYEPLSGRLLGAYDARLQGVVYQYYKDNRLQKQSYKTTTGANVPDPRGDGSGFFTPVEYTYDTFYPRLATMKDGTGTTTLGYHPVEGTAAAPFGDGRLASVSFAGSGTPALSHVITYGYDEYGRRVERKIDGDNNTSNQDFDDLGRLATDTNNLGVFDYDYVGNSQRVASVSGPAGLKTNYEYWPVVPAVPGTGNGDLRLKSIKHLRDVTETLPGVVAAEFDYEYAPNGNITKWTQLHEGTSSLVGSQYSLGYDGADQLTGAVQKDVVTGNDLSRQAWKYDPAGNREVEQISTPLPGGGYNTQLTTSAHNNLNQLTTRTGGTGVLQVEGKVNELSKITISNDPTPATKPEVFQRPDGQYGFRGDSQVTTGANTLTVTAQDASGNASSVSTAINSSGTGGSFTYDDAGNLIYDGANSYSWDAQSRLVKITYPGTNNYSEFTYDGFSRRVRIKEIDNGTTSDERTFVWDGVQLAERRDASNTLQRRYLAQGWVSGTAASPLAAQQYYCRHDHLGSIREVTNGATGLAVRKQYDLWGRTSTSLINSGEDSDFGYTGHYHHLESDLYLTLFRAYSPHLVKWMSRDPIGEFGGLNLLSYVNNNPVDAVDPDGLMPLTKICSKGIMKILRNETAHQLIRKGRNLTAGNKKEAVRAVEKSVPESKAVFHTRDGTSKKFGPHAQPSPRAGNKSHVYDGSRSNMSAIRRGAGAVTAAAYLGADNALAQVIDFFNPLSIVQDVIDVVDVVEESFEEEMDEQICPEH